MSAAAAWGIAFAALAITVWASLECVRNRPLGDWLFYALAALEMALVAQLVGGVVAVVATTRAVDTVTFVAYLVTAVLLPVVSVLWGASDKTRWGTAVLALGGLVSSVLEVRLLEIWTAPGG